MPVKLELFVLNVPPHAPLVGSGQAYVPGGGHRTGPPGKHVIGGQAKFRVMDDKVRYYVGPGAEILDSTDVSQSLPESARGYPWMHNETDHSTPPPPQPRGPCSSNPTSLDPWRRPNRLDIRNRTLPSRSPPTSTINPSRPFTQRRINPCG